VRESLVLPDRDVVFERDDADESRGIVRCRGDHRQSVVQRGGVRRDHVRAEALAEDAGDGRLPGRGRAEER
jgi:hypothetical protein